MVLNTIIVNTSFNAVVMISSELKFLSFYTTLKRLHVVESAR